MTKYLITGGAGFIGSHIAKKLAAYGAEEIIILDKDGSNVVKLNGLPKCCKPHFVDIVNTPSMALDALMEDVDVVLHNAAFVSIRGSFSPEKLRLELNTNCTGTLNILESAARCEVKKFIYASSMAVYGSVSTRRPIDELYTLSPNSPYGLSKVRGEMYCDVFANECGMTPIKLRYFNTYGIEQTLSPYVGVITIFINYILDGKPITMLGDGKNTRDFVWVEDVAEANAYAAMNDVPAGAYNIGSGTEISINDVAKIVMESMDCMDDMIYEPAPAGDIKNIKSDISKARKFLNYNPKGTLEDIIPEIVDYWRKKRS